VEFNVETKWNSKRKSRNQSGILKWKSKWNNVDSTNQRIIQSGIKVEIKKLQIN
jgi:hypothetical protein